MLARQVIIVGIVQGVILSRETMVLCREVYQHEEKKCKT